MDAHIKELVSPYLDKALPAPESARVEAHLAACADCRREVEETRRISALVAGLPKRPLPVGFMERLERKRAGAEAPATGWFPAPTRLAAFAAAGLVVAVLVYQKSGQKLGYRSAMEMQSAAPGASLKGLAEPPSPAAPAAPPSGALSDSGDSARLESSRIRDQLMTAAPQAEAADEARKVELESGAKKDQVYTNESLQGFLEAERKRLGIREIAPSRAQLGSGGGAGMSAQGREANLPMTREEAMANVRQMTDDIARANLYKQMKANPVVPLDGGSAPALLGRGQDSRPVETDADKLEGASEPPAGSVALLRPGSGKSLDTSVPITAQAGEGQAVLARAKPAAPAPAAEMSSLRPARKFSSVAATHGVGFSAARGAGAFGAGAAAPKEKRALVVGSSWDGSSEGARGPGGRAVSSPSEWTALWERLDPEVPPPPVDFSRQTALAVFGAAGQASVRVVSVEESGGRLRVLYQGGGQGQGTPYQVVLVPRTGLSPVFQAAP